MNILFLSSIKDKKWRFIIVLRNYKVIISLPSDTSL